jgi:hypothetical protein
MRSSATPARGKRGRSEPRRRRDAAPPPAPGCPPPAPGCPPPAPRCPEARWHGPASRLLRASRSCEIVAGDRLGLVPSLALCLAVLLNSCSKEPAGSGDPEPSTESSSIFTEIPVAGGGSESFDWPAGTYRIPEITAAGLAVFDADGDGDLDIYQLCHPPPGSTTAPAPNRLFRQTAPGRFELVPGALGLDDPGYGNGVAVGDIDGDGVLDVYVANYGLDALYRGRGDGSYENVTARSGIRGDAWSTGAVFFDYDRDGDEDLWVVHYLIDDPAKVCRVDLTSEQDYCGPVRYSSEADTLYRNDGGVLVDVSRSAGITQARAGLAVAVFDANRDGWLDVYVANDNQPNQLWIASGQGKFRDEALERGVAVSGLGEPQASMGIAVADVNGDHELDLFLSHLVGETSTLYLSRRVGYWEDRSAASGIGARTLRSTAWGCGAIDLDHDGDLDIVAVNGRIARADVDPSAALSAFWNPYAERNQLFLGDGKGRFEEAKTRGGTFTSRPEATRALSYGDFDSDGDIDLVTSDVANRLRVFRNDAPTAGTHWLRVRAVVREAAAVGAVVRIIAGETSLLRLIARTSSYASVVDPVAHFGLGARSSIDRIELTWVDGSRELFAGGAVDREVTCRRGEGRSSDPPR